MLVINFDYSGTGVVHNSAFIAVRDWDVYTKLTCIVREGGGSSKSPFGRLACITSYRPCMPSMLLLCLLSPVSNNVYHKSIR